VGNNQIRSKIVTVKRGADLVKKNMFDIHHCDGSKQFKLFAPSPEACDDWILKVSEIESFDRRLGGSIVVATLPPRWPVPIEQRRTLQVLQQPPEAGQTEERKTWFHLNF
jgi:hypothetical protein